MAVLTFPESAARSFQRRAQETLAECRRAAVEARDLVQLAKVAHDHVRTLRYSVEALLLEDLAATLAGHMENRTSYR